MTFIYKNSKEVAQTYACKIHPKFNKAGKPRRIFLQVKFVYLKITFGTYLISKEEEKQSCCISV